MKSMIERVEDVLAGTNIRTGVSIVSVRTGLEYTAGDLSQEYGTGSSNKTAALYALMHEVDAGVLRLEDTRYVTKADRPVGGTTPFDDLLPGTFTLRELALWMIRNSDNAATNIIMSAVGRERIREIMRGIGVNDHLVTDLSYVPEVNPRIWVDDHWEYTHAIYSERQRCFPSDISRIYHAIWKGVGLTAASRQEALDILQTTLDATKLRAGLPPSTPIGHKPGVNSGRTLTLPETWEGYLEVPGFIVDAGIVLVPGLEYVIAVMCEGENIESQAVISACSSIAFDAIAGGRAGPRSVRYLQR